MNELFIPIDLNGKVHIYQQIYEYIKQAIREGSLAQGAKLPSTRSFAAHLGVSRSTIELSYDQLLSEGYIESIPYKGYYVCKVEGMLAIKEKPEGFSDAGKKEEVCTYDFSPNAVDMTHFPVATWQKISKKVYLDHERDLLSMGDPMGDSSLRSAICEYLHSFRGVSCDERQIIVGAGNDYLLMLLSMILGSGRKMAVENPTYQRAYRIFTESGYEMYPIDVDTDGMRVDLLKKSAADTAYIMPSHQFPTGVIMPIGRRMQLLEWAYERQERYIIEDDYDSEFRYRGKPIPALQGADKNGKVIYLGTFSKSIAPAFRVSYMVLPKALLAIYEQKCAFLSSTVPRVNQEIFAQFISEGYYERYLNKMRKIYREKHNLVLRELASFEQLFTIDEHGTGLHVLLRCKDSKVSEQDLVARAKLRSCRVYGMRQYHVSEPKEGATIIVGYAALSKEDIVKGIARLRDAWLDHQ